MKTLINGLMNSFSSLLGPGGPQTKRLAYLMVITAGIVWLSVGLKVEIKREWNYAFGSLLLAVSGGYVGGKLVARLKRKGGDDNGMQG